jgi:Ni/Co efflux regulator RcnB
MKRILAVMAVLMLAIPSIAAAREGRPDQQQNAEQGGGNQGNQGRGRRGGGGGAQNQGPQNHGSPRTGGPRVNAPPAAPPQPQAQERRRGGNAPNRAQNNPGPAYARPGDYAAQGSERARGNDNNDNRRFDNNNRRGDNGRRFDNDNRRFGNDNDRRFDNDRRGFDRNRNFGYQRYAGRDFRFRGRSYVAVRAPRFLYPRGYGYRRWGIGAFLPLFFLSAPYYIDWEFIGLPPPPPGTEWVRYGPDALLVDIYTGRVIDTAYNVFY